MALFLGLVGALDRKVLVCKKLWRTCFFKKPIDDFFFRPMLSLASREAADASDQSNRFDGRPFYPPEGIGIRAQRPVIFES